MGDAPVTLVKTNYIEDIDVEDTTDDDDDDDDDEEEKNKNFKTDVMSNLKYKRRHGAPFALMHFNRLVYDMTSCNDEIGENVLHANTVTIQDLAESNIPNRYRDMLSRHNLSKKKNSNKKKEEKKEEKKENNTSTSLEPQLFLRSTASWTTSVIDIWLNDSNIVGYGKLLLELSSFFVQPLSDIEYIPQMWLDARTLKIQKVEYLVILVYCVIYYSCNVSLL